MPPKPVPPQHDFDQMHEQAVQLDTQVHGLLHERMSRQANRVFDQEWEQVTLPHLPLRHPFVVQRLDRSGLAHLVELAENDEVPELELYWGLDPRNPDQVGVLVDGKALGFLDRDTQTILDRAGEHADLYYLKVLQLDLSGKPELQMELIRPELRTCSACGLLHTEDKAKCADCRRAKKRKSKGVEPTTEKAPVPLTRALERLTQDSEKS